MHNTFQFLRERIRRLLIIYRQFTSRFVSALRLGRTILEVIAFVASVVCITAMIVYVGFDHNHTTLIHIRRVLKGCQILFLVNIVYGLLFTFKETRRENRPVKWTVDTAMLVTLLPLCYPHPEHPWIPILEKVLYSGKMLMVLLMVYSMVTVSFGIMKMLNRRTNPSLILSASFLIFIFIGSFLLMMPRCTVGGIDYIDSLFVSTSSVCITGLTSVDVSQTFTPLGLLVIAVMIQAGGLGIMTFTSFFALFFSGNASIYNQLMVRDFIYAKSMSSLLPTLLYIFMATVAIELAGAVAIFLSIHGTLGMSLSDELIFSAFHSLSAFCNAGFSNVEGGLSNPMLLHRNDSIYIIISLLVIAGGIGFPLLVNFKTAFVASVQRLWRHLIFCSPIPRKAHVYDLNSRIVLSTYFWLLGLSALLFFIFEYSNSLSGLSLSEKIIQSVFNATVPRSSGFASISPDGFLNITILMLLFLMWIGGASQSMAGGIKVNTFAVMLANLRATILGRDRVTVYHRTIATPSLRRAQSVIAISILALAIYCISIVALEPHLPVKALIYDATSALFTVGSSLGVTPLLSPASKILLCTAMFLGRVGMISLLVGVAGVHTDPPYKFPKENIIIN